MISTLKLRNQNIQHIVYFVLGKFKGAIKVND